MINNKNAFFKTKLIICIINVAFGIFMVIYGLSGEFKGYADYSNSMKFGADFYTEEYSATKNAANNLGYLINSLNDLGTVICIAIGMAFILCGLFALFCVLGNNKKTTADNTYPMQQQDVNSDNNNNLPYSSPSNNIQV